MKEREVRCKVGEGGRVGERWGREVGSAPILYLLKHKKPKETQDLVGYDLILLLKLLVLRGFPDQDA